MNDNRLIAEFMGINFANREDMSPYCYIKGHLFFENNLMYDKDWNWLMEVIEKINEVAAGGVVYGIQEGLREADIEKTYYAVVEFVKWWNENKKGHGNR